MVPCRITVVAAVTAVLMCASGMAHAATCRGNADIFYINGVNNTWGTANFERQRLQELVTQAQPGCPEPLVVLAMNHDALLYVPDSPNLLKLVVDAIFSLTQIFNSVSDGNPDLLSHLDLYRKTIGLGRKAIVVAHSAGNLYANEAFNVLAADGSINVNKDFSIVAVASPASFVAPFPAGTGPYVTLHEDLIASDYVFPVVNHGVLKPNATNLPDFVCASTTTFISSVLSCHDFVMSYLGGPNENPSGQTIVNDVLAAMTPLAPTPDDDFNGNVLDTNRWFVTINPQGTGTITATNQRLEMVKMQSGSGYLGLASKCKVRGDFDVQADFTLLNWPAQNFHTVRVATLDLPQGPLGHIGMLRNSYGNENYQARGSSGVAGEVTRSDASGKLRLKRVGTVLEGYYFNGTTFVLLGSSPTTTADTGFLLDFSSPIATSPHGVAIAFDNFKVNLGIAVCP